MAVLSDTRRDLVHRKFEDREFNERRVPTALSRADVRGVVDAIDQFLNANGGAIRASLPMATRGAFTDEQLDRLVALVAVTRAGVTG